jgi:hypothetical protein
MADGFAVDPCRLALVLLAVVDGGEGGTVDERSRRMGGNPPLDLIRIGDVEGIDIGAGAGELACLCGTHQGTSELAARTCDEHVSHDLVPFDRRILTRPPVYDGIANQRRVFVEC